MLLKHNGGVRSCIQFASTKLDSPRKQWGKRETFFVRLVFCFSKTWLLGYVDMEYQTYGHISRIERTLSYRLTEWERWTTDRERWTIDRDRKTAMRHTETCQNKIGDIFASVNWR